VSARTDRRLITLGIDFSGSPEQWRARRSATAVWIARIAHGRGPTLLDLRRVQELPGDGPPFMRLVELLRAGDFAAAGIDAPFAPPDGWFAGTREELLAAVRALPRDERPFATGARFVALLAPALAPRGRHVHRSTEQLWRRQGINVRSVLWNGPRGGAPFAAACLTLLAECGASAWPWSRAGAALLVETFPAAQLRAWDLPWFGYNGATDGARQNRQAIVTALVKSRNLVLTAAQKRILLSSADALDSVLCGFAARAVIADALAVPPDRTAAREGWIAVHH
jgi:hypothetical protein